MTVSPTALGIRDHCEVCIDPLGGAGCTQDCAGVWGRTTGVAVLTLCFNTC